MKGIDKIAMELGVSPEDLQKAIDSSKKKSKTKYIALGKSKIMTISGFKHLLPLYRKEIDNINERENKRMFEQLAAREGENCVDEFTQKMNNNAEYRSDILRKYKIE